MFRGLNLNLNLNSLLVKRQSDNPSPEKLLTRKEGLYYISMERKNSTDQIYTFVLCMHQSKFYHDVAHMSFRLYQGGKTRRRYSPLLSSEGSKIGRFYIVARER